MVSINVKVSGLETAVHVMHRFVLLAAQEHKLIVALTAIVRAQARRRFQTKLDPDGKAWPPLASSTVDGGREQGTMLVDTGTLANSITMQVSGTVGIVKTVVEYAKYHHTGSFKVPNHPPKRQFLGVGKADMPELEAAAEAWLLANVGL
ncbi:phage virion morphogenesis protein [Hyphomicrobium sp.]|uniref:phage virion morphogenesis protein n=1 Tax=Hyphomicrobium sp. TaxID=82 RepID=UPI001DF5747A|nr:phage virion morphogenesis protein [Hyphomicrobium sp.]MBY0559865.1 phage virion morphogenesis protein [Hyphomicrobium sp.]